MNILDNRLNSIGRSLELGFRSVKHLPHYKYFIGPLYKFCVNKMGSVAATGVSFLAADLVIHQLIPQAILCLTSQVVPRDWEGTLKLEDSCNSPYSYVKTLCWSALAIPVMYTKYKRNQEQTIPSEVKSQIHIA